MKIKKFDKKLALRKETVANMVNEELVGVKGGAYSVPLTLCCMTKQNPDSLCVGCPPPMVTVQYC